MVDSAEKQFRWVVYAFVASGLMVVGLLAWQLVDMTPAKWCAIAVQGTPEIATACVAVLVKLLELKQNVALGLLIIMGLSILSLAAVALRVRIGFSGPGGLSANVGADTTTITDGQAVVKVPTPPADNIQ